jgi:hypothetical protein
MPAGANCVKVIVELAAIGYVPPRPRAISVTREIKSGDLEAGGLKVLKDLIQTT